MAKRLPAAASCLRILRDSVCHREVYRFRALKPCRRAGCPGKQPMSRMCPARLCGGSSGRASCSQPLAMMTVCHWNNSTCAAASPLKYGDEDVAALMGWGGIQVFDPDVDIIDLSYEYAKAAKENSCGQCIPCRVGTKVLADIFEA